MRVVMLQGPDGFELLTREAFAGMAGVLSFLNSSRDTRLVAHRARSHRPISIADISPDKDRPGYRLLPLAGSSLYSIAVVKLIKRKAWLTCL